MTGRPRSARSWVRHTSRRRVTAAPSPPGAEASFWKFASASASVKAHIKIVKTKVMSSKFTCNRYRCAALADRAPVRVQPLQPVRQAPAALQQDPVDLRDQSHPAGLGRFALARTPSSSVTDRIVGNRWPVLMRGAGHRFCADCSEVSQRPIRRQVQDAPVRCRAETRSRTVAAGSSEDAAVMVAAKGRGGGRT